MPPQGMIYIPGLTMPNHDKVCHGTLIHQYHYLQGWNSYILDWSHNPGNASADVARTYLLYHLAGEVEMLKNI